MENKITGGEWISDCKSWRNGIPMSYTIQPKSENHFMGKSIAKVDAICGVDTDRFHYSQEEAKANAVLFANAGTTANKCGLLPSELLAQRDELAKELDRAVDYIKYIRKNYQLDVDDLIGSQNQIEDMVELIKKIKGE